jgi:hypothetical protein
VARQRRPVARGQQLEPVVEAVGEVGRRHRGHAHRGELDRQRDPVEPSTDPVDRRGGRSVEVEVRSGIGGALHEQGAGLARRDGLDLGGARHAQGGDAPLLLSGAAQGLAARRQHVQPRAGRQEPVDQLRDGVGEVLAVVEDQQQVAVPDPATQGLDPAAGPSDR